MADKRVSMPASTAGITSFYDSYSSKIEFKPGYVVVFGIAIIIVTLLLHFYGGVFLGA